ncbi:unnamed protein product [Hermetia illucens]|uniref:BTB domain-containing protein n=1 Tax=Hermetia illucens TaxID=343691 RepID=A0A7R8YQL9_HERIL|nr:unnamed protein product [Hermetia illucens]
MATSQQFSSALEQLPESYNAHKLLLSACSGYFKEIFKENPCPHPVIIFKFIKYEDLQAIIEFMYQGEVNVQQEALQSFLQTAELLSVQGLTSEEKDKPKSTKSPLEQRLIEEQLVKTLPATVRTVTTESNAQTQTQTIELQANIIQNSGAEKKANFYRGRRFGVYRDGGVCQGGGTHDSENNRSSVHPSHHENGYA